MCPCPAQTPYLPFPPIVSPWFSRYLLSVAHAERYAADRSPACGKFILGGGDGVKKQWQDDVWQDAMDTEIKQEGAPCRQSSRNAAQSWRHPNGVTWGHRVPACTEMKDKGLGRPRCLEAARMPVVWSVCVGSLCRFFFFSPKILRCQFKRTFTAIRLFVCWLEWMSTLRDAGEILLPWMLITSDTEYKEICHQPT